MKYSVINETFCSLQANCGKLFLCVIVTAVGLHCINTISASIIC